MMIGLFGVSGSCIYTSVMEEAASSSGSFGGLRLFGGLLLLVAGVVGVIASLVVGVDAIGKATVFGHGRYQILESQ